MAGTIGKRRNAQATQAAKRPARRRPPTSVSEPPRAKDGVEKKNVAFDCGWGRLLFGQTFANAQDLADCLRAEGPGRRDIAF